MTTASGVDPFVLRSLRGIAPLIADFVAQVAGLRSRPDTDGRTPALEAPLPMNATAFDDANALFAHLAAEVLYEAAWLDELPPVIDAWRDATGMVIGLGAHTTARQALEASRGLATWLEDRLNRLPEHAIDGLLSEVSGISKRHPFRDRGVPRLLRRAPRHPAPPRRGRAEGHLHPPPSAPVLGPAASQPA